MGSDGMIGFELCCCPAGSNQYDISTDVMRFRLELAGGGPLAPAAAFSGTPRIGPPPLAVTFTDASANSPTSWSWHFGDGGTSTSQHPTHSFTTAGRHTVSLTATNSRGSNTTTRTNYVTVASFSDIAISYWAWGYIEACVAAGIVKGFDDGTYRPAEPVDRAAMAVYISRALAGGDEYVPSGPATATFTDVATDHWAFKYVEYAYANDIVQGYSPTVYGPDVSVDRAQMAVFIARAIVTPTDRPDLPSYTPPETATFSDVATDHWAYKYIEYIAQDGVAVSQGYPDGTYRPDVVVTREQMAVYVQKAFGLPM
jgi:PKD repeat protein